MGGYQADDPAATLRWPPTKCGSSRGTERDLLCSVDRLPVEGAAEGFSAQEHGARVSHAVELGWHIGAYPSRALCRDARARGTRAEPNGGDHRLSKRQGSAKRGALLDPSGYDAGKKVKGRKRHVLVDTLGLLLSIAVHSAD